MRIKILSAILLALTSHHPTAAKRRRIPTSTKIDDLNESFRQNPRATAKLLSSATRADGTPNPFAPQSRALEDYDASINQHIAQYSIQFQGCHHIQQWNSDEYYDEEIRVLTKRLVRFRLVPYGTCRKVPAWASYLETFKSTVGKFDDFGEYIIDLNTFVYSYLTALSESAGAGDGVHCDDYGEACEQACENDDGADDDCMNSCYQFYSCYTDDAAVDDADEEEEERMDAMDYTQCTKLDDYEQYDDDDNDQGDEDEEEKEYYVGPYCAYHGAEIRMGLFSDDTCSTMAKCDGGSSRGASCYESTTGVALPYADKNIVQDACITCSNNYIALDTLERQREAAAEADEEFEVEYEYGYTRGVCGYLYDTSGKCESHMSEGYQYENACEYIEGIKIAVSEDGVVMGVVRSSTVDYALLGLAVSTLVLGMYLYYLSYVFNSPEL